jgi:hypothetical protein
MTWKKPATSRRQPLSGTYSEWKPQIAVACFNQCVYCAISESSYGGLDNFHVEHYRPKSKFDELELKIENLYLACAICNRFKSDDWPNEPKEDHSCVGYPDPALCDYNNLFAIDPDKFTLAGAHVASRYVIERLYLNRPQLIRERRMINYLYRLDKLCADLTSMVSNQSLINAGLEILEKTIKLLGCAIETQRAALRARAAVPYQLQEVRRAE